MPKAKVEKDVTTDALRAAGFRAVEVEVTERDQKKTAAYVIPDSPESFLRMVTGAGTVPDDGAFAKFTFGPDREAQNESPLAFIHRLYVASVDRTARASVYESLAQESTLITVGKEKVDIMDFPLGRLVKAINGMRAQREVRLATMAIADGDANALAEAEKTVDRSIGYGPWKTAAKRLVEDGKAKENEASGMLEATEVVSQTA